MTHGAVLGVYSHERLKPQKIIIGLEAGFKKPTHEKEYLDNTIKNIITDYCFKANPLLLERMAYELGELINTQLAPLNLTLTIKKPQALKEAKSSYVRICYS